PRRPPSSRRRPRRLRRPGSGCRSATSAQRPRLASAPGRGGPPGLAIRAHEEDLQGVEGLEALAGAEDDALEGSLDEVYGDLGLLGDAPVEAAEHAAAADEVDALDDEVLGQLGPRRTEALHHRV